MSHQINEHMSDQMSEDSNQNTATHGHLVFDILDYWHAGTGHGEGRYLDATVVRTPAGLPYIPGRTIKGLLRDVVLQTEQFGHLEAGTTEEIFGSHLPAAGLSSTQADQDADGAKVITRTGLLRIGSATLGEDLEQYCLQQARQSQDSNASEPSLLPGFFDTLARTALDEKGQARDKSLRRIEVSIPLKLHAQWSCSDPEKSAWMVAAIEKSLPLLRRFGLSRHRGLGRVEVTIQTISSTEAA